MTTPKRPALDPLLPPPPKKVRGQAGQTVAGPSHMAEETAQQSAQLTVAEQKKPRNAKQSSISKARHGGKCLLTRWHIVEGCHIIPFSWNKNTKNIDSTLQKWVSLEGLGPPFTEEFGSVILKGVGFTDMAWNIIPLSPNMHKSWTQAEFAIKKIGIESVIDGAKTVYRVKLQFVWLPRQSRGVMNAEVDINTESLNRDASYIHRFHKFEKPEHLDILNVDKKMTLESGQIFYITFDNIEDAINCGKMFDFQWAMMRVAAMSGAADEYGDERPPSPGPDPQGVVVTWLSNVTSSDEAEASGITEET